MPVSHCMFSAGRCVFWCPLAGAESDFCGRNGRWKGLIFRHNRVLVQNQGTVLKKSSHRGVHPGHFPSREGENERRPISCAHSSWIKRSTLLCRKMTWVHPVVSFPFWGNDTTGCILIFYSVSFLFVFFFLLLPLELGRCSSDLFLSSRPRTGLATTYITGYG